MKKVPNNTFFGLVENEIAEGKPVRFRLKGNSMFPLLRNGKDSVILEKCLSSDLNPMDVVLFRYRGSYVLHRIIQRTGDELLIQGDGSIVAMEQCSIKDVVGKVTGICRPSGKVVSVKSWKWTMPSRLWRSSNFMRKFLLRVAYKLFLKQI
jgi:hypothetical protein